MMPVTDVRVRACHTSLDHEVSGRLATNEALNEDIVYILSDQAKKGNCS